jgi:hypothetical protein
MNSQVTASLFSVGRRGDVTFYVLAPASKEGDVSPRGLHMARSKKWGWIDETIPTNWWRQMVVYRLGPSHLPRTHYPVRPLPLPLRVSAGINLENKVRGGPGQEMP